MCRFKSVKKLFCLCSAGFFAMLSLIAVIFAADIAVASADSYVANVAIFVAVDGNDSDGSSSGINSSGHAFIAVTNISMRTLTVGKKEIGFQGGVTLGTWGNKDPQGLWYNLESYTVNHLNGYQNRVSIDENVTLSQLQTINTYINTHESWSALSNCSTFASGVWNSFSDTKVYCGIINTPTNLKKSIMQYNYLTNKDIVVNMSIGYYINTRFYLNNPLATKNSLDWQTSFSFDDLSVVEKCEAA